MIRHGHEALDQVLELADIPRSPVVRQHGERRLGDAADVLVEARAVALDEEVGEHRQPGVKIGHDHRAPAVGH